MCYRTNEDPNMTAGSFPQKRKTFITLDLIFYIVIKVHMQQRIHIMKSTVKLKIITKLKE